MSDADQQRYRKLRFLVIDDQAAARDGLRTCAQTMGAFLVEFSSGYKEAIARVRRAVPDVILCDYNLGETRTGQHLLEELRRDDLLPEEAVFIMVTAEKSYENVVATVELGPDDYIIKPFSPDRLKFRLDRALTRKQFFALFYAAKREQDFAGAQDFLQRHLASADGNPYRFDLMRQSAELLLATGNAPAAHEAYRGILELHPFPWAKAGMARALLKLNRLQEARDAVDDVVANAPMYFEAFDLKAHICMEMGDHAEAQRTVEDASKRSTRNNVRKRLLADVALRNGDSKTALRAIAEVVQSAGAADTVPIADRLMLVRSQLDAGDAFAADLAMQTIAAVELETASLDDKTSHLALKVRLNPAGERAAFAGRSASLVAAQLSATARVDVIHAAFAVDDTHTATAITGALFDSGEIRPVFAMLRAVYVAHGMEAVFREMQKRAALSRIAAVSDSPQAQVEVDAADEAGDVAPSLDDGVASG